MTRTDAREEGSPAWVPDAPRTRSRAGLALAVVLLLFFLARGVHALWMAGDRWGAGERAQLPPPAGGPPTLPSP